MSHEIGLFPMWCAENEQSLLHEPSQCRGESLVEYVGSKETELLINSAT